MKTFYAVLIVFTLLIALILCNTLYIDRTTATLREHLSALPHAASTKAALAELEQYWSGRRGVVALSKPLDLVWRIDELLIELRSAVVRGDSDDFDLALRLTLDAVARVQRIEGLSAEILF